MGAGLSAEDKKLIDETLLTEKDAKLIAKAFKKHSKPTIDVYEFRELLQSVRAKLSVSDKFRSLWDKHYELFQLFDTNHDGTLDLKEVLVGLSAIGAGAIQDKAELYFKSMDKDNSGFLSQAEVARGLLDLANKVGKMLAVKATSEYYTSDMWLTVQKTEQKAEEKYISKWEDAFMKKGLDVIFQADADGDDKLSLEEWHNAVKGSNLAKAIVDPGFILNSVDVYDDPNTWILPYNPPN